MIPIADETDDSAYCAAPSQGWRKHFCDMLSGSGLEIGALHKPMPKHDKMSVTYIDRHPVSVLRDHYPEFNELPLVEPDIITDAQTLSGIDENEYDFLIASHVIEHMSSPLHALEAWFSVLKPGGRIYIVCPDKRAIFDAKRARTTLAHIVSDYRYAAFRHQRDWEHFLEYALYVDNDSHFHGKLDPDGVVEHAAHLASAAYSIHYHCFLPCDFTAMLIWYAGHIHKFEMVVPPIMTKGDSDFHCLLQKI